MNNQTEHTTKAKKGRPKKEEEPNPISLSKLKEYWDSAQGQYTKVQRKMALLDSVDRGGLWSAINAKFPPYQILPDTNHTAYIKNNILASIYTVAKSADILPTSEEDKDIVMQLNVAMTQIWDLCDIPFIQFQAGERAALLNLGLTQVGWSENMLEVSKNYTTKGNINLKNQDPTKFMRDPFATSLETAHYCMTFDLFDKNVFLANPHYKEPFEKYLRTKVKDNDAENAMSEHLPINNIERARNAADKYFKLIIYWVREGDKVHEVHVVDNQAILMTKKNIKPSRFPFAQLYCNLPVGAIVGTSEPAKTLANSVAYNIMDSLALTAEYKNQNPPKFANTQSGLNIQSFAKYGDQANKTFIVAGDASKAVHYHEFPKVSPILSNLKMSLEQGMEAVSGVDGRYTGRDTGSIITTGGTEEMLNRVTLIDTPKILNYEKYTRDLTALILENFLEHAPKRKYFYKKPNKTKWETLEVDFPDIDKNTLFNYACHISSELPKNKQRVAAVANLMMEKQQQYNKEGNNVQLITEEEWLMAQDLPNQEYMLERMGVQRLQNSVEEVSQVLFNYAELVQNGMKPEDAVMATADGLNQRRQGNLPDQGPIPAVMQQPGAPGGPTPPVGQTPPGVL